VTEGVADFDPRPVLEPAGGANQPARQAVAEAVARFGRIDVVVNNAG
jgi:NAD(P)-dependent dehydrogenase (short-subunit alcohol dehydrogenase family)